jgi:tRNA (guanine-N7-)-methyltransferase
MPMTAIAVRPMHPDRATHMTLETTPDRDPADFARAFPWQFRSRIPARIHPAGASLKRIDILEIGPGRGEFLLTAARSYPDLRYLGIELGRRRFDKLRARCDRLALDNVVLIHADARLAIPQFVPESAVAQIHVLFPDPWPKRRHAFLRLLSIQFLLMLHTRLRAGGVLVMRTDVRQYADWVARNTEAVAGLTRDDGHSALDTQLETEGATSHFERKWRADGARILRLCWRKAAGDTS